MREHVVLQIFRTRVGDLGIADIPFPIANFPDMFGEDASEAAMGLLKDAARNPDRRSQEKPTQAQLVDIDDTIIAEFRLTNGGARKVVRGNWNAHGT